jgi:WD40 repeat protein
MDDVLTLRTLPARFLVPRVSDVRFDPSGRRLVAATNSTDCFQWDVAAKRSSTWALPGAIRAAYTVSGDSVVAVLSQGGIALLDAATGATLRSSQIRPDEGTVLAIDATGRLAATGGADSLVRIWSLPELATVATVEPGFPIRALAFLPDGSAILAGGDGGRLAALKAPGWTIEKTTEAGTGAIVGIAVHRDSRIFATCADDGEIRRWDRTQAEPGTLVFKNPDPTDCITLSPDGTRLAIGTWNTLVRIIDFSAAREVLALYGHTSRVSAVTWSPDGNLLVSAAHDGTVRVWDGGEGE